MNRTLLRDLWSLGKPRITLLNVLMAAGGLALAGTEVGALAAFALVVGTALTVASANALNMVWERHGDKLMERTANRPLPAGRMSVPAATAYGVLIGVLGCSVLLLTNPLTAGLGLFALLSYVLVYTPMKRRSAWALPVGAVPGAMPPLMGWTAATGSIDAPGLVLFGVLLIWQIPHFLAISLFRKEDYGRAGIKTVPASMSDRAAKHQAVAGCIFLLPVSLALVPLGVAGPLFGIVALAAGVWFLVWSLKGLVPQPAPNWARRFFVVSLLYLPVTTIALAVDALVF